jgi:hypothetical protein
LIIAGRPAPARAATLLDKMTLFTEMIPTIRQCHPEVEKFLRKPLKQGKYAA